MEHHVDPPKTQKGLERFKAWGLKKGFVLHQRFKISEAIGVGTFAEIYRCTHNADGKRYALKLWRSEADPESRLFKNEVEVLRSLRGAASRVVNRSVRECWK